MPTERHPPSDAGRPAALVAVRERGGTAPGTPSRRDRVRESSAVQDPGLKDYVRTLFHQQLGVLLKRRIVRRS